MEYRRLTRGERYQIEALIESGMSFRAVGEQLGRSASTILRERRKCFSKKYTAPQAERETLRRQKGRYRTREKIQGKLLEYVEKKIRRNWSPEQIAGRRAYLGLSEGVSQQTIYRYIAADRKRGGTLFRYLRILRKERHDRKKPLWKPNSQPYSERTFITHRPDVVEKRRRLGDYERDTVFGKFRGPLLLTLVDRTSRRVKLQYVKEKSSDLVHQATVQALKNEPLHTITNDNGSEFARHQKTAKTLNAKVYFTNSYRSWEKGTNENTNGLIRQFFPRRRPIENTKHIKHVQHLLNSRPRKCLGYKTPDEVHKLLRSRLLQ